MCRLAVIASMRRKKIGKLLVQEICRVTNFKIKICQVANFKIIANFSASRLGFSLGSREQP